MSGVTARNGDQLVLYRAGVTVLDEYPDLPLIFACVVARCQGKVVFVFNSWRQEWELPSGLIEAGETPAEAAIRELEEESGQKVTEVTLAGIALLRLSKGGLELGVMFTVELDALQAFTPNAEESALMAWDLQPPPPSTGYVNELSIALVNLAQ
ncbi:MAG: NUDIX domain-containing protein [Chloroflexi bacterium]|nr:NUDIX domain-containing protein [Chloroflexota bacterium]